MAENICTTAAVASGRLLAVTTVIPEMHRVVIRLRRLSLEIRDAEATSARLCRLSLSHSLPQSIPTPPPFLVFSPLPPKSSSSLESWARR